MEPLPSAVQGAAEARLRRALRLTMNVLTLFALLLTLARVALWVRSYQIRDLIGFGRVGCNNHMVRFRRHFGTGQPYTSHNRLIIVPSWFPAAVYAPAPSRRDLADQQPNPKSRKAAKPGQLQ